MTMTMNAYESFGLVPLSFYLVRSYVLGGNALWPDLQFCRTLIIIQADPQPSFKNTFHWCCTQNILWTCHEHDNEWLWISSFGSTQLLFCQVRCLKRDASRPDLQFCHTWVSIQADPKPSFKHTSYCCCTENILRTCHEHDNEWLWIISFCSTQLLSCQVRCLRRDVSWPDYYNFATLGVSIQVNTQSPFLQTHIPLLLHTKSPLNMPWTWQSILMNQLVWFQSAAILSGQMS